MTAQQPQREQPVPGELVYSGTPWKIYRQDAGMGEHDYIVLLNDVYFCRTEYSQTAREIIRAVARPHPPPPAKFPNSTELLLMAHTDWKNRIERKHTHDEIPWVDGWIHGFLTPNKPPFPIERIRTEATRTATLATLEEIQHYRKQNNAVYGDAMAFQNEGIYIKERIESLRTQSTTAQERP